MNTKTIIDYNRNIRSGLHGSNTCIIGTVSGTDEKRIFVAPLANEVPPGMCIKIDRIYLTEETGVAAHDTNYWSFQVSVKTPAALDLLSSAVTTKITGGSAMVQDTPWVITPNQNAVLRPGSVLELTMTKAASAANLDELTATVIWHWEES